MARQSRFTIPVFLNTLFNVVITANLASMQTTGASLTNHIWYVLQQSKI